jgi:hypothetical protein
VGVRHVGGQVPGTRVAQQDSAHTNQMYSSKVKLEVEHQRQQSACTHALSQAYTYAHEHTHTRAQFGSAEVTPGHRLGKRGVPPQQHLVLCHGRLRCACVAGVIEGSAHHTTLRTSQRQQNNSLPCEPPKGWRLRRNVATVGHTTKSRTKRAREPGANGSNSGASMTPNSKHYGRISARTRCKRFEFGCKHDAQLKALRKDQRAPQCADAQLASRSRL